MTISKSSKNVLKRLRERIELIREELADLDIDEAAALDQKLAEMYEDFNDLVDGGYND
jgi:hypothetical protein